MKECGKHCNACLRLQKGRVRAKCLREWHVENFSISLKGGVLCVLDAEDFSCLETDWWLEVRGDKWREVTHTVRQKQKKPWDSGGIHETDRRWWMRFRGDGAHTESWLVTAHWDGVCARLKPAAESQQSAPVWCGPANVGQRKRDTFWGGSRSVDGGVTGNATGSWFLFYLLCLLHWDRTGTCPGRGRVFQDRDHYFYTYERRRKYIWLQHNKKNILLW